MNEKGLWWQRVLDACHLLSPKSLCAIRSHHQDQSHPGKEWWRKSSSWVVNQWCRQRKVFRDKGQLSGWRKLWVWWRPAVPACGRPNQKDSKFEANLVLRNLVSNPVTKVQIFYASLLKLKAEKRQRKISYAWSPDINWMSSQHCSHLSSVYGIWFRYCIFQLLSYRVQHIFPSPLRLTGKNKMVKM